MSNSPKREERRVRAVAAATLGLVMCGHTLLETARDALFLANIAVEHLPWVTIAIALLALAASRGSGRGDNRIALIGLLAVAVSGTLVLWSLVVATFGWSYYALYVWSGVITTLITVRLWLLLGDLFTITQGKRLYAAIAMGGSVGALVGAGLAAILAPLIHGEGLLLAAAASFALSAWGPCFQLASPDPDPMTGDRRAAADASGVAQSVQRVLASPYACRVALLVMIGGVTLTLGDYLFKSVLAEEVASDRLVVSLSRIYLGLNVLSIAMLALGVTPIVRRLGVDRSLAVLPALIALAGFGVLAGGALAATVFLKLSDGTLRYSLHKTASELLYLPMSSSQRASVKSTLDIVGQTTAKAGASILILVLVLLPDARMVVAGAVVIAALVWLALALRLRTAYLDVFRQTLTEGMIETSIDHPELDLESAGSLIRALSGNDVRRVMASLRILTERGHVDLIPTLILYHPSPEVVVQALDTFARVRHEGVLDLYDHLIDHEDARVRGAIVRARWVLEPDAEGLEAMLDWDCLVVKLSAAAGLLAAGRVGAETMRAYLDEAASYETNSPLIAAAATAQLSYHPVYRDVLLQMCRGDDPEAADLAIRAICASEDSWFTPHLVSLLADRRVRDGVRRTLVERGDEALQVLAERLVDPETPIAVLRHIPRTISGFRTPTAAEVLIGALPKIESGMVRFKLLRGLETLLLGRGVGRDVRDGLSAMVDTSGIRKEFERTLERSLDLLQLEAELVRAQREQVERATVGGELLVELLGDKRELATGRLFVLLGLMYPNEDFRSIQSGLSNSVAASRASSEELIENLLARPIANSMLGLVGRGDAAELLGIASPARAERRIPYGAALQMLLDDDSHSIRAVALYHSGEICTHCSPEDLPDAIVDPSAPPEHEARSLRERAANLLRDLADRRGRGRAREATPVGAG